MPDPASSTLRHPDVGLGWGAAITATVDSGVDTPSAGASRIPLVDVRVAHPEARHYTIHLRRGLASYPTHCGCGALLVLV